MKRMSAREIICEYATDCGVIIPKVAAAEIAHLRMTVDGLKRKESSKTRDDVLNALGSRFKAIKGR